MKKEDSNWDEKWMPWNWAGVEKVFADGGTPSPKALEAALRGNEPIPALVRKFLTKVVVKGFPTHRPTLTIWEKEEAFLKIKTEDASHEYAYRWVCCKICKNIAKGNSFEKAIELVATANSSSKNSIFNDYVRPDLDQLFADFLHRGPYTRDEAAIKRRDQVLKDVADEYRLRFETLRNRVTGTVYRKNKKSK